MSLYCESKDLFKSLDDIRRHRSGDGIHITDLHIDFFFTIGKVRHISEDGVVFHITSLYENPAHPSNFERVLNELQEYTFRLVQLEKHKVPRVLLIAAPDKATEELLIREGFQKDNIVVAFLPQYYKIFDRL